MISLSEKPVLFSESRVGSFSIGTIELNRPKALNALNTECYKLIEEKLLSWSKNPQIAAVVIESRGDKAFCAGGDVKSLALEIKNKNYDFVKDFFSYEYFVDCLIHDYSKPIIAFAHGITMGGGLGLINGASHRVVTESTLVAMPEVGIGLFPDVGATHFLTKCPNHFGIFMGLTGSRISASDALAAGLADYYIPASSLRKVMADLLHLPWQSDARVNKEILTQYFDSLNIKAPKPQHFNDYLKWEPLFGSADYFDIYNKFSNADLNSDFMIGARTRFLSGSPTAKQVFFEACKRHRNFNMQDVFVAEWGMAIQFSKENEFYEGVRAVLIDKDGAPKWGPAAENDVCDLDRFFNCSENNILSHKLKQIL
ncbi:MAG: enoyl-CoA hydratase/isomerase family protein [Bdellovibrionales bacterium]|nr:enoyl-CoA hydratase/isomerase family protein [Bdellovibrionales bacterium]